MRLRSPFSLITAVATLAAVAFARPPLTLSEDQRALVSVGTFGFLPGGTLDIDLQDLKIEPYAGDTGEEKRIGFLIQKGSIDADPVDWEEGCILDNPIFTEEPDQTRSEFKQLDPKETTFKYQRTVASGEEEMWNILFINCPRSFVSFKLKTLEINPGDNYLSAGDIPLPKVYAGSAVAYFVASAIWASMLLRKDTKVFWPHRLIFVLALMIGIQKTFQAIKVHYLGSGVDAEGWTVMFYIFAFLRGFLHILIITLIASGWMFIKPFLSQKDKKIILVIIPLQTQLLPMVDIVSCIVILGVIVQTQRHLGEAAETEGKVAENKRKYKLWGSFYLITVTYIYLTRILVEFLKAALPFRYVNWLVELLNEAITLGYYATIGWKFRPYANNPYTLIDEDDDEHDIESGPNDGSTEAHGLQTMSRREGRNNERDE
ncbi:hypothetical protein BGW38_009741 [Lunasporangiospora selenospora]|uniref:GOST seven transmembrane domain-containing protein n=1 Tax=Lunasporangiospora selenospora TaxID=979761 RepID=A0A9P6KF70_9FUNG|nr:hypothetical protein BGW38_009741 [Lunasporangiospora selenospora]